MARDSILLHAVNSLNFW